ncbi:hypothetical protein B0H17DRAFT_1332889 [Mycena rosella]|uniref:Uncharacterized protein n=1 Tax=Mycena rosella TaxID=1033263 RepID=A0AAD7D9U5_MYCRO|nr:hypothetical protein B0H17DRAFT_1332889 [Mycena rosella]
MATHTYYRTASVTAAPTTRPKRLSLASLASLDTVGSYTGSAISTDSPICITTTVTTRTCTFPAPALPPFTMSLGSDDPLPRPRRGAPPVAPARTPEEREERRKRSVLRKLCRALGLQRTVRDPALCEGWD